MKPGWVRHRQQPEGGPPMPEGNPPANSHGIVTTPAALTPGTIRGMSFGDRWIEVAASRKETKALERLVDRRGRTGPRSMAVDDVVVSLSGSSSDVRVSLGGDEVGSLTAPDAAEYAPTLQWARYPVESSGIILIDAEGHPGTFLKLYLPRPDLLVPANAVDPTIAIFPARDRAGGVTLATRKAEYALVEEATASWWQGVERSAWVVLTREGSALTASMNGMPLPSLDADRVTALLGSWDRWHHTLTQMQFEAMVYDIKAGRQVNVRFRLG